MTPLILPARRGGSLSKDEREGAADFSRRGW